ncbi:unnamed protein product [Orchesella dallaii]|uniref:Uncharacterized protein n=1 Tax=Orchesella dallaii TaxID=48710 RepID=A0ABP1RB91_9HEXA
MTLNETTGAFDSLSSTGDEGIAVVGEDHIPNFAVSEHDTLYYVPRERTVRVAKYQGFKKYSYKLELSDEEIARTGYTGKTIVALVNKTFSHELYHLRRTNECSSVSIRQKNCSHICVVGEGYRGSCRCPLGFKMEADDDTTCVEVKLNVCNEGQFKCSDNSCIKEELLCDGVPDCREGEDEENCKDQMNCPRQTFHCGKNDRPGMCIPIGWFYDNEEDCEDGSDERSCTKYSCKETDHYCEATDRCVPKSWICALRYNCPGIDAYQFCRGYNCNTEQFLCADLSKCISRNWFCDTGRDCPDGSDEPSEYCPEVRRR